MVAVASEVADGAGAGVSSGVGLAGGAVAVACASVGAIASVAITFGVTVATSGVTVATLSGPVAWQALSKLTVPAIVRTKRLFQNATHNFALIRRTSLAIMDICYTV